MNTCADWHKYLYWVVDLWKMSSCFFVIAVLGREGRGGKANAYATLHNTLVTSWYHSLLETTLI